MMKCSSGVFVNMQVVRAIVRPVRVGEVAGDGLAQHRLVLIAAVLYPSPPRL